MGSTPFDVVVSIVLALSALVGFATWMLIREDWSQEVVWWQGAVYVLMTPLVVVLHVVCAPITAVAHVRRSWKVHLHNSRLNSLDGATRSAALQELMPQ